MKRHGTATDRLVDVIQVLQIAHKTGLLTVHRGGIDNSLEQGTITFHNGQVIDASVGQLRGMDAFKKLVAWGACQFIFQSSPAESVSSFPAPSLPDISKNNDISMGRGYKRELPNGNSPRLVVPRRLRQADEVLTRFQSLGLSRTHRQLFLLIDGKRSVEELMRLLGHRSEDVLVMLFDLEAAGLIRQ